MQRSLFLLMLIYGVAVAIGTLFVAVGLYAPVPTWLAPICSGNPWFCRYPFIPMLILLPLLFLYRKVQSREERDEAPWARRLRSILD
jgi:hypothetical protein